MLALLKKWFRRPKLRLFYLSFCGSEDGCGESYVAVVAEEHKGKARRKFLRWLIQNNFDPKWYDLFLRTSVFSEKELNLQNVIFSPLGRAKGDAGNQAKMLEDLKKKGSDLLRKGAKRQVMEILHACERT